MTIDDYLASRDPALEAILTYVPEPPITEQLLAAFADGDVEAAQRFFRAYIANPIREHVSVEGEINALGYELLGEGRVDEAVAVFQLNVEAYPQSANVYDSLGDGYRARGDREAAIAAYRKALEVDPTFGPSRENLARLLGRR